MGALQHRSMFEQLREELDRITSLGDSLISSHPELVAALCGRYNHTIRLANDPHMKDISLAKYNCFAYAFGLVASEPVRHIASVIDTLYPGSEFADYVVKHLCVEAPSEESGKVGIVLYWKDDKIVHAGKVRSNRIVSKWGMGQLWEHDVFEVPMSYGNRVTFYHPIEKADAERVFVEYSRQREGASLVNDLLE